MSTNKWEVVQLAQERVIIQRVEDAIIIAEMFVSIETDDGLLSCEQATDVAQQIVDDWNFSCDELEPFKRPTLTKALKQYDEAAETFTARCESGEIRSSRTYLALKKALEASREAQTPSSRPTEVQSGRELLSC